MGQILFYDENGIRVFDCCLFDIKPPEQTEIDVTGLEDMNTHTIVRTGTTATASITLGEVKAELDPTTMKRIAKYNLDKDFEEINQKIKSVEDRIKFLNEEMETKEKKLDFMQRMCQQIWNDDCFDEDDCAKDEDYEDDDWGDDEWE